jgi:predicted DNA-binding transcriptional regulator YafY
MQTSPMTVTEIHEALSKRMHLDVSRKTIERDMVLMIEMGMVSVITGVPSKYTLNKPNEIEIVLTIEEISEVLQIMNDQSKLYTKFKKSLDILGVNHG